MIQAQVNNGDIVEDGITTTIRGETVTLTPNIINHFLGYNNPPQGPFRDFSFSEIYKLLMPGESVGTLPIRPKALPDIHRIIFYIYSRAMVNKSRNFTHITERDYLMLASILAYEPRNVGQIIFDEIVKFRFHSSAATPVPYPQLVSFFLKKNHIWYLEPTDKICRISSFGLVHLNRMRINAPTGALDRPQRRIRRQEVRREEPGDEAQSSFRTEPAAPSFLGATIQNYIEQGFKKVVEDLKSREEHTWQTVVETFDRFTQIQSRTLQEISSLRKDVTYLRKDVTYLNEIVLAHISSQLPPHPSERDTQDASPIFTSSGPTSPTSIPPVYTHSPSTPATEILPSPSDSSFNFPILDPGSSETVRVTFSPSHASTSLSADDTIPPVYTHYTQSPSTPATEILPSPSHSRFNFPHFPVLDPASAADDKKGEKNTDDEE